MQWNRGAIHEAIATAKAKKKIFLVYIEGTDDASKTMSEAFNNPKVVETLGDECIPVKLEANSVEYRQFHQIYPILIVPSTFFIGTTGIPLEVAAGALELDEFIGKIQRAKLSHQQSVKGNTENVVSSQASSATGQEGEILEIGEESQSKNSLPEDSEKPSTSTEAEIPLEERVERAKQLLTERKEQRVKEEQEKEKMKEMELRKLGKEMHKAKVTREQKDMEEWAQTRKKEREEEQSARERVRQQIAQDRAERAARSALGTAEPAKKQESPKPNQGSNQFQGDCVRIQLRLPDGSSMTREFPISATLGDVHLFAVQDVRPAISHFSLATTFPRRQFQQQEYSQTLVSLGLAPSAVLLLVPEKNVTLAGPRVQIFWSVLNVVFSPVMAIWSYLMSFFRTRQPTSSDTTNQSSSSNADQSRPGISTQGPSEQAARRRLNASNNAPYRREGNIHRFANDGTDSDEENNTWNGNSTQQL